MRNIPWRLLYSLSRDGISYHTLEKKLKNFHFFVVAVTDKGGKSFGGFFTGKFWMREGFWGTGESFLFELTETGAKTYHATLENNLFCFSDEDGFGLGSQ